MRDGKLQNKNRMYAIYEENSTKAVPVVKMKINMNETYLDTWKIIDRKLNSISNDIQSIINDLFIQSSIIIIVIN